MKQHADKKRRDIHFQVGDMVLVKLQPYRQQSVALRKNQKLGMRYFGPFFIIEKIGPIAYKLQLPEGAKRHSVFHISLFKKFKGETSTPYMPLPLNTAEVGPVLSPIQILDTRTILKGTSHIPQLLIRWQNTNLNEATWEDLEDIAAAYPNLNLEDKVPFKGEGIVTCKEGQVNKGTEIEKENFQKLVTREGHVALDPGMKAPRRSSRARKANKKWEDSLWALS